MGYNETAQAVLAYYHGKGDSNHTIVRLQTAEMEYQISAVGLIRSGRLQRAFEDTRSPSSHYFAKSVLYSATESF